MNAAPTNTSDSGPSLPPTRRSSRRSPLLWVSLTLNVALLAGVGYFVSTHGGIGGLWSQLAPQPPLPLRWDPRAIEHFKQFPHEPHATVFLGDSIVAEAPFAEYFSNLRSRGLGGDTTGLLLSRLDEAIQNTPDRVFINIGTNDLSKNIEPDELLANYKKILEQTRKASPAARIYVISILPISLRYGDSPKQRQKQKDILAVNKSLATLAASMGAFYIDVHTKLSDDIGSLQQSLTWDGLHLNWAGYRIYCQTIREFVDHK